jgi:hypothetical protein
MRHGGDNGAQIKICCDIVGEVSGYDGEDGPMMKTARTKRSRQ